MLSRELESNLNLAFKQAKEKHYEYLTVEYLLLILLDNTAAAAALQACGADLERLQLELGSFIAATTPLLAPSEVEVEAQPTWGFQRVLQRAIFQAQSAGHTEVTGANVLIAIFGEQDSQAVYFLRRENVTRLDVMNYISHGISKVQQHSEHEHEEQFGQFIEEESAVETTSTNPLESYTINLNLKARAGRIDPLIGRHEELDRVVQILCRRRKNNPLLVGEAGVGKTAIAEGLALAIVQGQVAAVLGHSTIYALDLGSLLAGTKYRGDFEKRLKSLLWYLKKEPTCFWVLAYN